MPNTIIAVDGTSRAIAALPYTDRIPEKDPSIPPNEENLIGKMLPPEMIQEILYQVASAKKGLTPDSLLLECRLIDRSWKADVFEFIRHRKAALCHFSKTLASNLDKDRYTAQIQTLFDIAGDIENLDLMNIAQAEAEFRIRELKDDIKYALKSLENRDLDYFEEIYVDKNCLGFLSDIFDIARIHKKLDQSYEETDTDKKETLLEDILKIFIKWDEGVSDIVKTVDDQTLNGFLCTSNVVLYGKIALALARWNYMDSAVNVAVRIERDGGIRDEDLKSYVLWNVLKLLMEMKSNLNLKKQSIRGVCSNFINDFNILDDINKVAQNSHGIDGLIKIFKLIPSDYLGNIPAIHIKKTAAKDMARDLVALDRIDEMIEIAKEIPFDQAKTDVFCDIAKVLLTQRKITQAVNLIKSLTLENHYCNPYLGTFVKELTELGCVEEALEIADKVYEKKNAEGINYIKDSVLVEILSVLIEQKNADKASEVISKMSNPHMKTSFLKIKRLNQNNSLEDIQKIENRDDSETVG